MLEFPVFCELTETEREYLYGVSRVMSYPPGVLIYKEGDPGDGLYCVLAGAVTVSRKISENQQQVLATFTAGSYFGEMAINEDRPRSTSARTEAHTELLFVPRNALEGAMANPELKPKLLNAFLQETFRRLRETNRIVSEIILRGGEAQMELERMGEVFKARAIERMRRRAVSEQSEATRASAPGYGREGEEPFEIQLAYHTQRLSEIVDEVIQITRMNGWSLKLGRAKFCLNHLLKAAIDRGNARLGGKGLDLELRLNGSNAYVAGDPYLLDRALTNLLTDAVASAKAGGKLVIDVSTHRENGGRGRIEICITSEHEPGIEVTAEPELQNRANGGNGLPAVRQIAWLHEGSLSSRRVNEPFCAMKHTLTLPLCAQEE